MVDRDSRLRVAPWLPSQRSASSSRLIDQPGEPVEVDGLDRYRRDHPTIVLRPIRIGMARRRRGHWWFLAIPLVLIALAVAVLSQMRIGPAPRQAVGLTPPVAVPERTTTPSAAAGTVSPSPSVTASASVPSGSRSVRPGTSPSSAPPRPTAAPVLRGSIVGADGRCLEPAQTATLSTIQPATCTAGDRQRWSTPGDGTVRTASGLCLDVFLGARGNGSPVLAYVCNGNGSQQWRIAASGWRNPQSNRCLTLSGTRLTIADCTGAGSQRWSLT